MWRDAHDIFSLTDKNAPFGELFDDPVWQPVAMAQAEHMTDPNLILGRIPSNTFDLGQEGSVPTRQVGVYARRCPFKELSHRVNNKRKRHKRPARASVKAAAAGQIIVRILRQTRQIGQPARFIQLNSSG